MMIRITVPILVSLDLNYEGKLVQKATNIYLEKKRYYTKRNLVYTINSSWIECACYRRFTFTEKEIQNWSQCTVRRRELLTD